MDERGDCIRRAHFSEASDRTPSLKQRLSSACEWTKALPGTLVILCEGRNRGGFYICRSCGAHMTGPKAKHKSPSDSDCGGTLERFSLGHELVTDVVRLQFPQLRDEWDAYSVAYAVLLGAAETLDIPGTDLNVTTTSGDKPDEVCDCALRQRSRRVPGLWRN